MFPPSFSTPEYSITSLVTEENKYAATQKEKYAQEACTYFDKNYDRIIRINKLISNNYIDPTMDKILNKMESSERSLSEKKNNITSEDQKILRQDMTNTLQVLGRIQEKTTKEIMKLNQVNERKRKEKEAELSAVIKRFNEKKAALENEKKRYYELKRQYLDLKKDNAQNGVSN